jgi:hypothetical protein
MEVEMSEGLAGHEMIVPDYGTPTVTASWYAICNLHLPSGAQAPQSSPAAAEPKLPMAVCDPITDSKGVLAILMGNKERPNTAFLPPTP